MADNARVAITKLNNVNYQVWKYKLELLLIKEDLWDVVIDTPPTNPDASWMKRDGKARATMGLLIEDNQLIHVRKTSTAREAWNALQKYHEKASLTRKVHLLKRLCSLKLTDDGNMEDHLNNILELVDQLVSVGEALAQHLVVAMILCSLPDSYDVLITALESRPEEDLTLEMVKGKLIDEYKKRKENQMQGNDANEVALKVQWKRTVDAPSNVGITEKKCYYCNKAGHFKRDCRKFKAQRERKTQTVNTVMEEALNHDEEKHLCFNVNLGNVPSHWYVDSGATCHMSNDRSFFNELDRSVRDKVHLANGQCTMAHGAGKGILKCLDEQGKELSITVENVLYVPELQENLLSVNRLVERGLEVNFDKAGCRITKDGIAVASGQMTKRLFMLNESHSALKVSQSNKGICQHQWHRRLGHRNTDAVNQLEKQKLAKGIKVTTTCNCRAEDICVSCIKGKMTRRPFPKESRSETTSPLELVHTDVCGPMQTLTPSNKRYVLTLIDDFSRYTVVYLLQNKSEVLGKVQEYVQAVHTKFGKKPKTIRSDRGGEYTGHEFKKFLQKEGIEAQYTAPYSPQQNGVAERKNRYLMEMARCMLIDAGMPKTYWGEAVNTANYLQNRLPTKATGKTPYERWHGTIPNIAHVRTFGCTAFAHVPKERRQKLDEKAKELTLVGYAEGCKAYRLLDKSTNRIHISRDVHFDEFCERSQNAEDHKENETVQEVEVSIQPEEEKNAMDNPSGMDGTEIRRSQRINKGVPPNRLIETAYAAATETQTEPKDYKEAVSRADKHEWENAMLEEIKSLQENETWELVELPKDRKAVGCKWVYKLKQDAQGNISRYKARLVARGFSQKYGQDYDEVFAPVVKQTTFRTLLSIAGKTGMTVRHYDVKTAFLNGDLQETIYMQQPKGYEVEGKEHLVCKLKKSLYGLKQSARAWNQKIDCELTNEGFKRSKADPCLYSKCVNGEWLYVLIYVDDMIIASIDDQLIESLVATLEKTFQMSCLGDVKHYLGIHVEKDQNGAYRLHQKTYIDKIVKQFGLEDAKCSKIPIDTGYMKNEMISEPLQDDNQYQELIGSLLYIATNTRPDIAASTAILSRKVSAPNKTDWIEAKRIVRYLKGTSNLTLKLGNEASDQNEELVGYADSDWAGDTRDRKSNSGYIFKLNGGTISWASRKQTCVALSSMEAEYVALAEACQEGLWIRQLLNDLNQSQTSPTTVFEDNQSCLKLIDSEKVGRRSKHIDTKYHFIRDLKNNGVMEFKYCPTEKMPADILTKPLDAVKTKRLATESGLVPVEK